VYPWSTCGRLKFLIAEEGVEFVCVKGTALSQQKPKIYLQR
jgi:hypothetical protein